MNKGLLLTRRTGQSVEMEDVETGIKSRVTFLRVGGGKALMYFDCERPFCLLSGQWALAKNMQLEISIVEIVGGTAKMRFAAPPSVKIVRTELLSRA